MKSINPATGQLIKDYPEHSFNEIESKLVQANKSFLAWSQHTVSERSEIIRKLSQLLRNNVEQHARLITLEMGKPIQQSRAEILKSALACEFYANNAEKFLKAEQLVLEDGTASIQLEPLGLILGIMPWNYPYWQVFRFAIAPLMAGNAIILKHAPNVCGCALALEQLFREAGFPEHLFQAIFASNEIASKVIQHPLIKGVALTGSDRAGVAVATHAGQALKKVVLELGGSDPFIILEDAHLSQSVEVAFKARLNNCGQSCIAAKRFIIVESHYDHICKELEKKLPLIKIGDPLSEETEIGPIAREDLLQNLERQVHISVQKGAKLIYGGKRLEGSGYFYQPALLTDVQPGMPAYDEEIFGPVFSLIKVKDAQQAIAVANDSAYGLGASLWTQNLAQAQQLAKQIQSGSVFINAQTVSNVHLPFGGVKRSGYGRELSHYGIKEFVNIKTVFTSSKE